MADDGENNRESPSKKPTMTDDDGNNNRSSSSVHEVVFNDDLLIEILLRLPVISLVFFKSVSKRWLSLITSPAFVSLHVTRPFPNIQPPCGFLLQETKNNYQNRFVSLDSGIPVVKKKKSSSAFSFACFGSDASKIKVLQSCNGSFLCVASNNSAKIFVYNPSVSKFKMLPQIDGLKFNMLLDHMRLAFDPTISPHYKVLHYRISELQCPIQTRIYSSERDCWIIGDTFSSTWFCNFFDRGVYWNDALHWIDITNRVRHFKLDLEHPHHTTTQHPKTLVSNNYKELFECRGCLLLACAADPDSQHLEIYEMGKGYSGWSLKYIVKYKDSSIGEFFETWNKSPMGFRFNVQFIVVGEREEESFVVMKLCRKVVKYNLLSKTLHLLCDIDTSVYKFSAFPFIASFASV